MFQKSVCDKLEPLETVLIDLILISLIIVAEPKKDKTDGSNNAQNGAMSPNGEGPLHLSQPTNQSGDDPRKPERPSSLGHGKLTRRLLCYHSEQCEQIGLIYIIQPI